MNKIIKYLGYKAREHSTLRDNKKKFLFIPYIIYLKLLKRRIEDRQRNIKCNHFVYYMHISKCASSTIVNEIKKKNGRTIFLKSEKLNNKFLFTFVRNPYNRILSTYLDKLKFQANKSDKYKFNGILNEVKKEELSFEDFVKIICITPDYLLDEHIQPYNYIIKENKKNPDFVGKLENFKDDWNLISKLANLSSSNKLEIKNDNRKSYNLNKYYTQELLDLVYKRYKDDFISFGYEKELHKITDILKKETKEK